MLYDKVVELIGEVPPGLEPIVYIISALMLIWLLSTFFSVLWSFLSMIGGGKS